MILYITAAADNRCMAIHQSLDEARAFASAWVDKSGANRVAARIYSHDGSGKPAFKRGSDQIILKNILEEFPIISGVAP